MSLLSEIKIDSVRNTESDCKDRLWLSHTLWARDYFHQVVSVFIFVSLETTCECEKKKTLGRVGYWRVWSNFIPSVASREAVSVRVGGGWVQRGHVSVYTI